MISILGNTRKPDVNFLACGRISISARVAKVLNLAPGDVIDLMDDNGETYLYVKHRAPVVGRHEGMIFRSNPRGRHFIASSVRLCRYIFSKCNTTQKVALCCGPVVNLPAHGIAMPIITKLPL